MTKRRIYMGAILFVSVLVHNGSIQAGEEFTLRSLMGTFGFSGLGTLFLPLAPVPAAVVGLSTFDGTGACETTATLNTSGVVSTLSTTAPGGACSYSVNPDGTGNQSVTFPGLGSFTSHFVIVDARREVHFVLSSMPPTPFVVASGVSRRQD